MTDSARYADVVLPATTFLEHADLRNGYGAYALQYAEPAIAPVGEARPNYEVFGELVRRLGLGKPSDDFSPLAMLRSVVDDQHTVAVLRAEGIAYPPSGLHPVQFVDVFPRTADSKVHLVPEELDAELEVGGFVPFYTYREDPRDARHPLTLISPATEKLISSSMGETIEDEQPLALHPEDAAARG